MAINKRRRFVYRVENEDGKGPYRGVKWKDMWDTAGPEHPTPARDPELQFDWMNSDGWFFGFATMAQLRAWFFKKEWRQSLKECGCRVVKYAVPAGQARYSDAQAIFRKENTTQVLSIDLGWL